MSRVDAVTDWLDGLSAFWVLPFALLGIAFGVLGYRLGDVSALLAAPAGAICVGLGFILDSQRRPVRELIATVLLATGWFLLTIAIGAALVGMAQSIGVKLSL